MGMTRRTWALGCLALSGCRRGEVEFEAPSADEIPEELLGAPEPRFAPTAAMRTRPIPRTGESLPVIGLGTGPTFAVGREGAARAALREVLGVLTDAGGRVIDAPPTNVQAEQVVGELLMATGVGQTAFLAASVWTRGQRAGQLQMEQSLRQLGRRRVDLMQVHALIDFTTHLETLRRWRVIGHARYIGATVTRIEDFPALEQVIRTAGLDFVQLPFSIVVRAAEERMLSAAADHGVAVLISRPFAGGQVFDAVRHLALPEWAAEIECSNWSQLLLKWILAHDAVHCLLPATGNPRHMADNIRAGFGPLPDAEQRRRLVAMIERR